MKTVPTTTVWSGDPLAVQFPEPGKKLALWSCNQVLLVTLAWQSYRIGLNLRWPRQDRILVGRRNKAWDKYRIKQEPLTQWRLTSAQGLATEMAGYSHMTARK